MNVRLFEQAPDLGVCHFRAVSLEGADHSPHKTDQLLLRRLHAGRHGNLPGIQVDLF